jgi:hypothetical protein
VNYADAFNASLTLAGAGCVLFGIGVFLAPLFHRVPAAALRPREQRA